MTKHLLCSLLLAAAATAPAWGQIQGNGYYRIENATTLRYAYLTDDKAKINATATTVDARAVELWKGFEKASCDPATVLYMSVTNGNDWNIQAQGANLHNMLGYYLHLRETSAGSGIYYAYGTQNGATKYLGDSNDSKTAEQGEFSSEAQGDLRKWFIKPISATGDNYFGVQPLLTSGSKHYAPFFADFPFSASSSGLKFYYVSKIEYGVAVLTEITGTVPGGAPVIIECSSNNPSDNRLNIGGSASALSNNKLGGVYFCRTTVSGEGLHVNVTPYDKNTMRLLTTAADGSLVYSVADVTNVPRNQAYLKVPTGSPSNIKVMKQEEYDAFVAKLPTSVTVSKTEATTYVGSTVTLSATVAPADASDKSLTWTSSNTAVATVNGSGVVTGVSVGTATITVKTINGKTATCTVNVRPQYPTSVAVGPQSGTVFATEQLQMTATVTPADVQYPAVTWTTSDNSVATIDQNGMLTGVKSGNVTVTATAGNNVKGTAQVRVAPLAPESITVSSSSITIRRMGTQTLGWNVLPADAKDRTVTWTSADPAIATVDQTGTVTGVALGTTIVTVAGVNGVSAQCEVKVVAPLPTSIEITEVVDGMLTMNVEERMYVNAVVLPEDATQNRVIWTSSNEEVAKITAMGNSMGQIRALTVGECTITAETQSGLQTTFTLVVNPKPVPVTSVTVTPSATVLEVGESAQITATVNPDNATDKTVVWTSSDESVVTVDAYGLATAVAEGSAKITATAGGKNGYCTITVRAKEIPVVEPESIVLDYDQAVLTKGETFQLSATLAPDDVTETAVFWHSTDEAIATVSDNGLITAVGGGVAIVNASTVNGLTAACMVTVDVPVVSIELTPEVIDVIEGSTFAIEAAVMPEDATDKTLEWSSSNEAVATVDANGVVSVLTQGEAVITAAAADGSGVKATCLVNGISGVEAILGQGAPVDVYTTGGVLLHRQADADTLSRLPRGVYVIGGAKVLVK